MSQFICKSCRATLKQSLRPQQKRIPSRCTESSQAAYIRQYFSSSADSKSDTRKTVDVDALLSKPSWSIESLLPNPHTLSRSEITPKKLHHLLRLSALPPPKDQIEEEAMLETLHTQLQFVRNIQKVDTEGIEPLQMIRDETEEGIKDITIGMEQLADAFAKEEIKGRNKRPRRRKEVVDDEGFKWDVFSTAEETVETPMGKFFVVKTASGKGKKSSAKDVTIEDDGLSNIGERDVEITRKDLSQGPAFIDPVVNIKKYKAKGWDRLKVVGYHYDARSKELLEEEDSIDRVRQTVLGATAKRDQPQSPTS